MDYKKIYESEMDNLTEKSVYDIYFKDIREIFLNNIVELKELPKGSHREDKPKYKITKVEIYDSGVVFFMNYVWPSGNVESDSTRISLEKLEKEYNFLGA